MSRLYCIGDVHLSNFNVWYYEAGAAFLKWLEGYQFEPDSEVCLTGDITDRHVLTGKEFDQLDTLIEILRSKFVHTWICMGNHDLKRTRGELQHPLLFLNKRNNVTVVTKETAVTTKNGFKALFLPFQKDVQGYSRVERYYDEKKPFFDKEYDTIVAHVAKKDEFFFKDDVDLSTVKTRSMFLGHIHYRNDSDYLGSVFPLNALEEGSAYPRCVKWLDKTSTGEIELPKFLTFKEIKYPYDDAIPEPGVTTVFSVLDCPNLGLARERYPDVYVNKVVRKKTTKKTQQEIIEKTFASFTEAFTDWRQTAKDPKVNRRVIAIVNQVLEGR